MPYHVPLHDSWRPSDLAEAFRSIDIPSEVSEQRVSAVIPILDFMELDERLATTALEERTPKKLGDTTVVISFRSELLIANILIDFDVNLLMSPDRYPDFLCLMKALEKCGYVFGSELEIVQLYLPDDADACRLIDEIETRDLRKMDRIANEDYVGAKEILHEQMMLRTKLEDMIRNLHNSFARSSSSGPN